MSSFSGVCVLLLTVRKRPENENRKVIYRKSQLHHDSRERKYTKSIQG